MKSVLTEFCEERMIPDSIKIAFGAYIRSEMARKFMLGQDGETVHLMMSKLSQEQLAEYWKDFTCSMKEYLIS